MVPLLLLENRRPTCPPELIYNIPELLPDPEEMLMIRGKLTIDVYQEYP